MPKPLPNVRRSLGTPGVDFYYEKFEELGNDDTVLKTWYHGTGGQLVYPPKAAVPPAAK
jgi:hypothetical protein